MNELANLTYSFVRWVRSLIRDCDGTRKVIGLAVAHWRANNQRPKYSKGVLPTHLSICGKEIARERTARSYALRSQIYDLLVFAQEFFGGCYQTRLGIGLAMAGDITRRSFTDVGGFDKSVTRHADCRSRSAHSVEGAALPCFGTMSFGSIFESRKTSETSRPYHLPSA